jgi:multidrug efflux system membrane fusion protein
VPVQTVAIVPQVGGKVIATHVGHGDYIKKGQLLFEIDPRPFEAALESAKASLAQGQAELDLARVELSRVEEAVASAAVSRLEYDQKKAAVAMAQARVAAAEAAIDAAELDVEYSKIRSPIDGKAGVRRVDPGNVVKNMDEPLLMVQQMDPIYAEFTITENDLGTVRKFLHTKGLDLPDTREEGLTVMADIPADSARVLGALGMGVPGTQPEDIPVTRPAGVKSGPREGSVMFLDNIVQEQTGTVRMRATLPNADRYFWPGQFVSVRLILTRKERAVLVPAEAQQIGQQGPFVYVVNADNKAEIRPITPGQRHGDLVVVEQGVGPGERVIISGHMTVTPGGPVVVTNSTSGPGPVTPPQHAATR